MEWNREIRDEGAAAMVVVVVVVVVVARRVGVYMGLLRPGGGTRGREGGRESGEYIRDAGTFSQARTPADAWPTSVRVSRLLRAAGETDRGEGNPEEPRHDEATATTMMTAGDLNSRPTEPNKTSSGGREGGWGR